MASRAFQQVTVVRPYGEAIRKQVFAILKNCGLSLEPKNVIPVATSDAEVIKILKNRLDHVLLIPFHGHLDANKKIVNGITLYRQIRDAVPELSDNPVLMPVDSKSAAVVESLAKMFRSNTVLVIAEDQLQDAASVEKAVKEHVASCR